jgi:hypothetical protein
VAGRGNASAFGSSSDECTILDEDDTVTDSGLSAERLSLQGSFLSGRCPTDEDDPLADFDLHDRDSAGGGG